MSGDAGNRRRPARLGPESLAWLILVSVLFGLSELIPALLRLPLGADEISYIARSSIQHSGVYLPPVHGHGAGLLGAPVTLLTASLTALRVWMAALSGLALFGSLLCWRGLRTAWVLAIAGLIFGSLAITDRKSTRLNSSHVRISYAVFCLKKKKKKKYMLKNKKKKKKKITQKNNIKTK